MLKDLIKVNFKWLEVVFFAGTAAGAAVGLAAGVGLGFALGSLTAPKSGKELRDDIAEKANDIAEEVKGNGQKMADKASDLYSNMAGPDLS